MLGADGPPPSRRKSCLACGTYRQDLPCCFSLVVTTRDGDCLQPLRQRPLNNFSCFFTKVVWDKHRLKRSQPQCARPVEVNPYMSYALIQLGANLAVVLVTAVASCWLPRREKSPQNPQESLKSLLQGWLRSSRVLFWTVWLSPASLHCLSLSVRSSTKLLP